MNGLTVNVTARAFATGGDGRVTDLGDAYPVFQGVAAATLQALFLESADQEGANGLLSGGFIRTSISPESLQALPVAQARSGM